MAISSFRIGGGFVSISSVNDPQIDELKPALEEILEKKITRLERIGGGKNSQVYHITCRSGDDLFGYALKRYFRHSADQRDRLGVEYGALRFLSRNGITCVPVPVAVNVEKGLAVYEYIEGTKKEAGQVTQQDIDDAVSFLKNLDGLKSKPEAGDFIPASEAFFSIQAICDHVHVRLERLKALNETSDNYVSLRRFLSTEVDPAFHEIICWCKSKAAQSHFGFDEDIPLSQRTLSPSDFGFHNALWRNGRIVFLDFEYFGWDDPAKMTVDFLLHPALPMQIDADLKRRYVGGLVDHFKGIHNVENRIQIVYPLFALKWIMIILNEFLPADLLRRQFAEKELQDKNAVQILQLEKGRKLLDRILAEYKDFPYFG